MMNIFYLNIKIMKRKYLKANLLISSNLSLLFISLLLLIYINLNFISIKIDTINTKLEKISNSYFVMYKLKKRLNESKNVKFLDNKIMFCYKNVNYELIFDTTTIYTRNMGSSINLDTRKNKLIVLDEINLIDYTKFIVIKYKIYDLENVLIIKKGEDEKN